MLSAFKTVFAGISGFFTLQNLEGFPYSDWNTLQEEYTEYQEWYDGVPLQETSIDEKTGTEVEKYPIKINPIPNTCEKHATLLFGNSIDSIRDNGLPISFTFDHEVEKEQAKKITKVLRQAFLKNGGGAMFISNGTLSQYLGGCVFGVEYKPTQIGDEINVFSPLPTEFYGTPDGNNPWELQEAWFIRQVSPSDAKNKYGYPVDDTSSETNTNQYYYIEHWTKDTYRIQLNEQTISINGVPLEGANPWGLVPFIYIPHERSTTFWGRSIINEAVEGIITEMNMRNADIGDAINNDAHTILAGRGLRQGISYITLDDGRKVKNLGAAPGMSANDTEPDLFAVRTDSASSPMIEFTDRLENLYRRETKHPAVADGEDEGSQRSSLTLTTRMLPLQAHVKFERINWTVGLMKLATIILTLNYKKGLNNITEEDTKIKPIIKWPPMLPRDREELVNETAIRKKNGLGSKRHMLEMFQDVDDIDEELSSIEEDEKEAAERETKLKAKTTGSNFSPSDKTTQTNRDQAQNQIKKKE